MDDTAYFERLGADEYRATDLTSGAWNPAEQHIAPAMALLAHELVTDLTARRGDDLVIGRLCYEILGTVPVGVVNTAIHVLRPGRTIELLEARLRYEGRDVLRLTAWALRRGDTAAVAGTPLTPLPAPETLPTVTGSGLWPGKFIQSIEIRRSERAPGDAVAWLRTLVPLLQDEAVGQLARAVGLFDVANGVAVRARPDQVLYPNVDLTAHLFTQPRGDWVGFDTRVTFGADGLGLTNTVLHDEYGPIGSLAQLLTVRPRPGAVSGADSGG